MLNPTIGALARGLGAWNLWRWPVFLFVVVFPFLAYYWGDWGPHWKGENRALYGPASLEGVAVLLSHPVSADPVRGEGEVEWSLHLDPDSAALVDSVFLRYRMGNSSDAVSDSSAWPGVPLQAVRNRHWTGSLALPAIFENSFFHIELSLLRKDGTRLLKTWPLGWRPALETNPSVASMP